MPQVHFTSNLQRHLDCASMDVAATTVNDALQSVFRENPRLRSYVLDDQGRLRRHVNVFVNGGPVADRSNLSDALARDDQVFVMQALSGG